MSGIGTEIFKNSVTGMAGNVIGSLGSQIGYGLGELTGYNERLRKEQLQQQQALTNMQYAANSGLMKESYQQQLDMWNNTNYGAQIEHIKNAGLNPAMLYAKGGAGGTTGGGSASVGGGQASDQAARQQANTAQAMSGMAMMKLQSEIKLNEAQAKNLIADANTKDESRSWIVEKLKQEGKGSWLDNLKTEYLMSGYQGEMVYRNKNVDYGETGISSTGLFSQQAAAELAQTLANSNNQAAQALLTNEKAKGYWQELLNDTIRADNDKIKTTSIKLAAEWSTGEFTNWKTWADLARGITTDILKFIK